MFTIFKSIDKKFEDIGFHKLEDNKHFVEYARFNKEGKYTQVIDIYYKSNGKHIVLSYDKDLFDVKKIGNTCVGLTYYEMKLVLKKMKQKKWKSK